MSDIVERLRDIAENGYAEDGEVDGVAVTLLREAAAEIARLRAENAALRADLALCREREGATGLEYRGG